MRRSLSRGRSLRHDRAGRHCAARCVVADLRRRHFERFFDGRPSSSQPALLGECSGPDAGQAKSAWQLHPHAQRIHLRLRSTRPRWRSHALGHAHQRPARGGPPRARSRRSGQTPGAPRRLAGSEEAEVDVDLVVTWAIEGASGRFALSAGGAVALKSTSVGACGPLPLS